MSDFEDGFEAFLMGDENKIDKMKTVTRTSEGYVCPNCNRSFTLPSNLTRHMRHNKVCGISKGFECANCHKLFSLNATMKDHYLRCVAEDPYRFSCPNCPKQFTFKSSLNKHLRGRCRTLKKKALKTKDVQIFACRCCAAEFYDESICARHEIKCAAEPETQAFICPHCTKEFTLKSSLSKHLKGRCKVLKTKTDIKLEDEEKVKYVDEKSSNVMEDDDNHEVEIWFGIEDVIEEMEGDILETTRMVESVEQIRNEIKKELQETLTETEMDSDYDAATENPRKTKSLS